MVRDQRRQRSRVTEWRLESSGFKESEGCKGSKAEVKWVRCLANWGRAFELQNWPAAVLVMSVNFVAIFEVGTPDPESVKGTEDCEGSKERKGYVRIWARGSGHRSGTGSGVQIS